MVAQLNLQTRSGFNNNDLLDIALPSVVNECLVHRFKYWHQEGIHQGARYNSELYTLLHSYLLEERLKTYAIGCRQAEQGFSVLITVSKIGYSVWLSLRSLNQHQFAE